MIHVELQSKLSVSRGKLITGGGAGTTVHAATFLREGRIVLDRALLKRPRELKRIFVHELFHFVWWKLGNGRRKTWESILANEFARCARGELGWSAEYRKNELRSSDLERRTRAWREYCCESFCDSGASLFIPAHDELTLARRFRTARHKWLRDIIQSEEELVQFACPSVEILDPTICSGGFRMPAGLSGMWPLSHGKRTISQSVQRSKTRP